MKFSSIKDLSKKDTFDGLLSAVELGELINQYLFTERTTHPKQADQIKTLEKRGEEAETQNGFSTNWKDNQTELSKGKIFFF